MARKLLILMMVTAALAGCGKKAMPDPPDKNAGPYPRSYPSDNADPRLGQQSPPPNH